MALNSIMFFQNKIKEIEENNSISPPSTSHIDRARTIPNESSSKSRSDNFQLCKSKSYQSLHSNIIFGKKIVKRSNVNSKHYEIETKNISIDKQKNINNIKNTKSEYLNINNINNKNLENFNNFKFYKLDSDRLGNANLFQQIFNLTEYSSNSNKLDYSDEKININIKAYNNLHHKRIFKKNIKKPNVLLNNKIIKNTHLLIQNKVNPYDYKLKEKNSMSINPNANLRFNKTSSNFYKNNSNSSYNIRTKPYIKKIIEDSKNQKIINKNESNNNNNSQRYSLQTSNLSTNKKRPLILNVNLMNKSNKQHLKISQFRRVFKKDGILHILRFLDYYDLINIFRTKNKKILILINQVLAKTYYNKIKFHLLKYNSILELLNGYIVNFQIKDSFKIDLVAKIRFIKGKYKYLMNNYKDKNKSNFTEPLYYQLSYLYNYFRKIKPQKELITMEELENLNKSKALKMHDYYIFDLYPENYYINNNIQKDIFISRDIPLKERHNNIANVQPILPFLAGDIAMINLELYSSDNGFIEPDSIKIIIKECRLKDNLKMIYDQGFNNPRISEYEELCGYWKNINLYENKIEIIKMVQMSFSHFFRIIEICFDNIGVYIFKVRLKAMKVGELKDKRSIGIKIKIKEKNQYIENEIRKNYLLFERRDIFEIRVGDELIYYFYLK